MRKFIKISLLFTLIVGLVSSTPLQFGSAQESSTFKISGYILDANGNSLKGANIIFNVPSLVPSVNSDSSGYYEIFAPQGTY
ncbi:MAG: carboxypeptidase-like regulatory domain-containing protein, partial [Candidatus Bathyarchaeota archaeon]|nr:carboxypeptidase-like regulatory domain-containing protein [Candidatus Bathyarchaeum sp.]